MEIKIDEKDREIIDNFDSNLEIISKLCPSCVPVYRVRKGSGKDFVMKFTPVKENSNYFDGLLKEVDALKRLSSLSIVPSIVEDYGIKDGYLALGKNYVPGTFWLRSYNDNTKLVSKLKEGINLIHNFGVGLLEINARNLKVNLSKNKVSFIDLGNVSFVENVGSDYFQIIKRGDFEEFAEFINSQEKVFNYASEVNF